MNPDNVNVASSPIIADFCNELVDVLTRSDEEKVKAILGNGTIGET